MDVLTHASLEHGGSILTNCVVDRIVLQDGRANGVVLSERSLRPGARSTRGSASSPTPRPETMRLVEQAISAADARRERRCATEDGPAWVPRDPLAARWAHPWGSEDFDPLVHEATALTRVHSWVGDKYTLGGHAGTSLEGIGQLMESTYYAGGPHQRVGRRVETDPARRGSELSYGLDGSAGPEALDGPIRREPLALQRDDWPLVPELQRPGPGPVPKWTPWTTGASTAPPSSVRSSAAISPKINGSSTGCLTDAVPGAIHEQRGVAGGSELDGGRLNAAQVVAEDAGCATSDGGRRGRLSGTSRILIASPLRSSSTGSAADDDRYGRRL